MIIEKFDQNCRSCKYMQYVYIDDEHDINKIHAKSICIKHKSRGEECPSEYTCEYWELYSNIEI